MDKMGFTAWYDPWIWCAYDEVSTLKRGDRVRIREGYDRAGTTLYYEAKSNDTERVIVVSENGFRSFLLPDAIEPYPYSREERIERAISDFEDASGVRLTTDEYVVLFAILDAGV